MMMPHQSEFHPCDSHLFMLSHQKEQKIDPRVIQASFCLPHSQKHPRLTGKDLDRCHLNCPTFNNDRNCATTAFVTTLEKLDYREAIGKIHIEHDDFPIASRVEKSELFQPKPKSKNKYCHVCKITYKDYRMHIRSKMHKECIPKSPFNEHIIDLAQRYQKRQRGNREARVMHKMDMIAKTAEQESDQVLIINRVENKEKRNESFAVEPNFIRFNSQVHRDFAHPFSAMSYQHEQPFLAYQAAFYQNLFQNSAKNTTHSSFSPSIADHTSVIQGKIKKSLTYIIIDE